MQSGIFLLDKPTGLSSAQALNTLKKKLGLSKLGHAGTLDPLASGLLVVLAGGATRLASFAQAGQKVYSGTIRFGLSTDTDDIDGEVLASSTDIAPLERIREVASSFIGEIEQIPPQVSALKVAGRRAYDLARDGQTVDLAARKVCISELAIAPLAGESCSFRMRCSKGTYVRSWARDMGRRLGCGACLASLRREESSPYSVQNAKTLDEITYADLLGWETLFPSALRLEVEEGNLARMRCGDERVLSEVCGEQLSAGSAALALYGAAGKLCGVLVKQAGQWEYAVNLSCVVTPDSLRKSTPEG